MVAKQPKKAVSSNNKPKEETNESSKSEDSKAVIPKTSNKENAKKTLTLAKESVAIIESLLLGESEKANDPIEIEFKKCEQMLKAINNGDDISIESFKAYWDDYLQDNQVTEDNLPLKLTLENSFRLISSNMAKDKLLNAKSGESTNALVESLVLEVKAKESGEEVSNIMSKFRKNAISKSNLGKIIQYSSKWRDILTTLYKE